MPGDISFPLAGWELPDDPAAAIPAPAPAKARKAARPRDNARAIRTAQAVVRMLPAEMRSARAAAKRAKHPSLSSFVRALVLAGDKAPMPALDEAAAREVARLRRDINSGVGANLNQALHHANEMAKGGRSVDADALLHAVRDAAAAMEMVLGRLETVLSPRGRA